MQQFSGTGVAIVTPMNEDKSIDYQGLEKLLKHLVEGGVDYLVVQGTTGESATLNQQEKQEVLDAVKQQVSGKLPVVFGIGGNNTAEVVRQLGSYDLRGVDGILSVSPYYNKPTQEGVYQHYKEVAGASQLPVILYNVPSRTGSNITADTTLRLATDVKNIVAIKEASGDLDQIGTIIRQKPEGFIVVSGDDGLTLPMIATGAEGVISVIANVLPREFSAMVRAAMEGDTKTAKNLHHRAMPLIDLLFSDGNPGGAKAALNILGICKQHMRLPLVPVNQKVYQALQAELKK